MAAHSTQIDGEVRGLQRETDEVLPLLSRDSNNGFLHRVVTGFQSPNAWRRMFTWPAGNSEPNTNGTEVSHDVETGEGAVITGTSEHDDISACSSTAVQAIPAADQASVEHSHTIRGVALHPAQAPFLDGTGSPTVPRGRPGAALPGLHGSSEITANDMSDSEVQSELDTSNIVVAAVFDGGQNQQGSSREDMTGRSRTLGERVVSYGRDLLGLSKSEGAAAPVTGSDDSVPGIFKSLEGRDMGGSGCQLSRSNSSSQPTCLICLEPLTSEDFLSGEAISLDCVCRGELALRHRTCAIKWSRVKGDAICDICRSPVKNLPAPSPRASHSGSESEMEMGETDVPAGAHATSGLDVMPGNADLVFDCIRVGWVAMIVCILFFSMDLSSALWTGIIVGLIYSAFVRSMMRQQLALAALDARQADNMAANSVSLPTAAGIPASQPMPTFMHQMIV